MSAEQGKQPRPPPTESKRYLEPPSDVPANNYTREARPSVIDAVKMISWEDLKTVHTKTCVRESYLNGMGVGFAFGGLRFALGGGVPRACNWAVGAFVGASLLSYEYCMYRRKLEKEVMMRAARVIESKRMEKEAAAELRRQEKMATEEKAAREAAAKRSWYKLW